MSKQNRDSKDPQPMADNSQRVGGGNAPAPAGETHKSGKAEKIGPDQRFSIRAGGESQPTREGQAGNTPVTGEKHGQSKAERISADRRY